MSSQTLDDPLAFRRDVKVLLLVSLGHFFSHFYIIVLPPLFPLLAKDLSVTYAALGAILMAENLATTLVQVPVGFIVDKLGARRVLVAGLTVMSGAVMLAGFTESYFGLLALMILAGLGNAVFHPADYAIMASRISPSRLGRAFSVHTFAGHLGWAIAPGIMVAITAVAGWQWALVIVGAIGLLAALLLALMGKALDPLEEQLQPKKNKAPSPTVAEGLRMLMSPPMMLFFLYMLLAAVATSGLNGFTVAALIPLYDAPLEAANLALTGFLALSAVGVLLGGQLADWTKRHEVILTLGFLIGAAVLFAVGAGWLSFSLVIAAIALSGLSNGAIRPSRDMMVRQVIPVGSEGKAFAFVTVGMNVGAAIAPVFFGWLIDSNAPAWVFYFSALALLAALVAALTASHMGKVHPRQ